MSESEPATPRPRVSTRRLHLLIIAAALTALIALTALTAPVAEGASGSAATQKTKPTVVLVHGSWADGSGWSKVVARLQRAGYPVRVPPNPLRSLSGDAATVANFLSTIPGPIVLVGHSYGGR